MWCGLILNAVVAVHSSTSASLTILQQSQDNLLLYPFSSPVFVIICSPCESVEVLNNLELFCMIFHCIEQPFFKTFFLHDLNRYKLEDANKKDSEEYKLLGARFGKYHGGSSLVNLFALIGAIVYAWDVALMLPL